MSHSLRYQYRGDIEVERAKGDQKRNIIKKELAVTGKLFFL